MLKTDKEEKQNPKGSLKMEKIKYINGNGQKSFKELPTILIKAEFINDVWLDKVYKTSKLKFKKNNWGYYETKPNKAKQITQLLIACGGSKVRYYDNWLFDNTLLIKFDHHVGFDVDSICFDCAKHNNIRVNGLKEGVRLLC